MFNVPPLGELSGTQPTNTPFRSSRGPYRLKRSSSLPRAWTHREQDDPDGFFSEFQDEFDDDWCSEDERSLASAVTRSTLERP